jgi:hypothetical protein
MAVTVEAQITTASNELANIVVGNTILASSINSLVSLATKETQHVHSVEDAFGDTGPTTGLMGAVRSINPIITTENTSTIIGTVAPASVVAGQSISPVLAQQILNIVASLNNHTHTFTDTIGGNCNCNCDCTRGRM